MEMATTTPPAPSGSARLGRHGQIVRTMEDDDMDRSKRELEVSDSLQGRSGEARFSKGNFADVSGFLAVRSVVSRHYTEILVCFRLQ